MTVVGKPRSYETDDGETNVAVRPESITQVDEATRDRWVVETADQTIDRLKAFDEEINDYAQMARDEYGERLAPYREAAIEALESLDATDDSVSGTTSGAAQSEAAGNDSPGDSNTEPVEADAEGHSDAESEESSPDESGGAENPSEGTGLGEYD